MQVSDFGLSALFRPGQEHAAAAQHGALAYMPPELIACDTLTFATDAYSFGILLWELLTAQVTHHMPMHAAAALIAVLGKLLHSLFMLLQFKNCTFGGPCMSRYCCLSVLPCWQKETRIVEQVLLPEGPMI